MPGLYPVDDSSGTSPGYDNQKMAPNIAKYPLERQNCPRLATTTVS